MNTTMKMTDQLLLVNVSFPRPGEAEVDRSGAADVANSRGENAADAYKVERLKFPETALKPYKQAVSKARARLDALAFPYSSRGWRMVTTAMYPTFVDALDRERVLLNQLADDFASHRDEYLEWNKVKFKDFNPAKFPTEKELRAGFNITVQWMPFPSAGHFTHQLADNIREQLQTEADQHLTDMLAEAEANLTNRLKDRLARIVTNLTDKKEIDGPPRFHKSMMEGLVDLLDTLPKLNVRGDQMINDLRDRCIKELAVFDTDTLKADPAARAKARSSAASILKSMGFDAPEPEPTNPEPDVPEPPAPVPVFISTPVPPAISLPEPDEPEPEPDEPMRSDFAQRFASKFEEPKTQEDEDEFFVPNFTIKPL